MAQPAEHITVSTEAEITKHYIDLTRDDNGECIDPSAKLGDLMVQAGRLKADSLEIPAELLGTIRSMVGQLRERGESAAVAMADTYAATVLAVEGIDFTTGTRKVVAAPEVGGAVLPTEAMY